MNKVFNVKQGSIEAFFRALNDPQDRNLGPTDYTRFLEAEIIIPSAMIGDDYGLVLFHVEDRGRTTSHEFIIVYEYDIIPYDDVSKLLLFRTKSTV